jgi:uncharacterized protein (DUF1800 family)
MPSSFPPLAAMRRLGIAAALIVAAFGASESMRAQTFRFDTAEIVRFLEQSTWGPTPELIAHVRDVGIGGFLDEQFDAPMTGYPDMELFPTTRDQAACPNGSACQRDNYTMHPLQTRFFRNALYGEDQLRQRVAFALHQIIVVSGLDVTLPGWMTPYLQTLYRNAFGDYRNLLYEITVNPAMGNYLDINGNSRTRPNENYAREVLQLFSIGTVLLNPDGTPQLDRDGLPLPAYDQTTIDNFSRVFTGLRFNQAPRAGVPNYIDPMVVNEPQHDTDQKVLLNGIILPAGQDTSRDVTAAIDHIANHPNVAPFIAKQLIQHLVTSNPSPDYVRRVADEFDGPIWRRRNLRRVVRGILLDPEARKRTADPAFGRLRNPVQFITNVLRAFNARSADGSAESDGVLYPQSAAMGMDLFRPPSVFSYFSPFGALPGGNGLRGPEFGVLSTSTALARLNFVNTMVYSRIAASANGAGTSIDLSPQQPLAAASADLVNELDTRLLHGSMSAPMRESIAGAVNAVPASDPLRRVRTAVYLVLTSSQYQVQR